MANETAGAIRAAEQITGGLRGQPSAYTFPGGRHFTVETLAALIDSATKLPMLRGRLWSDCRLIREHYRAGHFKRLENGSDNERSAVTCLLLMAENCAKLYEETASQLAEEEEMPTLRQRMMKALELGWGAAFDGDHGAFLFAAEGAIYWFCADYHDGQCTELYSILSCSEYKPGALEKSPGPKDDEIQAEMYRELVAQFGKG
jgi:hypothetical protein